MAPRVGRNRSSPRKTITSILTCHQIAPGLRNCVTARSTVGSPSLPLSWRIPGQQELLNWVCLAGAMSELGRRPVWADLAKTYMYAAPKAFAIFEVE